MLLNRKMNLLYYAEAVWTSAHLEARTVLMMIYLIGLLIPYSCAFQKYLVLPCTGPCNWISRIISRSCNVQPRRGIDSKAEIRYDSKVPKKHPFTTLEVQHTAMHSRPRNSSCIRLPEKPSLEVVLTTLSMFFLL